MVLIVCIDDKNGMAFNGRRQSRDSILCERIMSVVGEKRICMRPDSAKLFSDYSMHICFVEVLGEAADNADYYFAETDNPTQLLPMVDEVIVYRWNRTYPADLYFPTELLCDGWSLVKTFDFPGNSHERISEEVYRR